MISNLEKYKDDLDDLISKGEILHSAIQYECYPEETEKEFKGSLGDDIDEFFEKLPSFELEYQSWYSEAKSLIGQLLPGRLDDFVRHYQKPKSRKKITFENYRIEDYLQNLTVTRSSGVQKEKVVGPDAAVPQFRQQLSIVKAVKKRFESSLFDIQQLVQADLFDSELDAAEELLKHKFLRAAGALAGVVVERHLGQVCKNHEIKVRKKNPSISDLNNKLKEEGIIEIPEWRFNQHLADIRNLCDHNKDKDPTKDQVDDLISGAQKITKTIF